MDGVVASNRQSASLPPLMHLEFAKKDPTDSQRAQATATMASPSYATAYPTPSQSFPLPTTATNPPTSLSGLLSTPESRRTSGEDSKEPRQPPRQSLPSIHEALGSAEHTSYPPPNSSTPAPIPPHSNAQHPTSSPKEPIRRSFHTDYQGPPPSTYAPAISSSPFLSSSTNSAPPTLHKPPPMQPAPPDSLQRPLQQPSHGSKLPTLHPLETKHSPSTPGRPSIPFYQPQPSPAYEGGPQSAGPVGAPYGYAQAPPHANYPFSAPPQGPTNSTYPPGAAYSAPPRYANSWRNDGPEVTRVEENRRNGRLVGPNYGESVKRHLDNFDMEASLNQVLEGCGRVTDFAKHYAAQAHQTQRSGLDPRTLPKVIEIDDIDKHLRRAADGLARLREVVVAHNSAMEQAQDSVKFKGVNGYDGEDNTGYSTDPMRGNGGFAGADPKKRRGRAAPPGRCHSCNRAETPEWRRGPDGARTLCNACGLHYAKLTRKMGTNKAPIGSSNLRPKSLGPGSPAAQT